MSVAVFRWPVRVYHEDTDSGGIVYYANYLRFMERARSEWLRSLGVDQRRLRESAGLMFVVASARVDYLRPARLDDTLEVGVSVRRRARASLTLDQPVHRDDGELLCRGEVRIACIDAAGLRPRGLPTELLAENAA